MRCIETDRLRLRPAQAADVDAVVAAMNDWSVAQWIIRPPYPYTPADAAAFIAWTANDRADRFTGKFAIALKTSDALLGSISVEQEGEQAVIGYWLRPEAAGQGYASEAAGAALAAAFAAWPIEKVVALTDPDNHRSQAVLRRQGFVLVETRPRQQPNRRGGMSTLVFELARPR